MVFGRHVSAILGKEWLYWKRNIIRSLVELSIPFILMGILLSIRLNVDPDIIKGGPDYNSPQLIAIDPYGPEITMGGVFNFAKAYEFIFDEERDEDVYAMAIAPNNTGLGKAMLDFFKKKKLRALGFLTEKELLDYAANPTIRTNKDKLINASVGIYFHTETENQYSYKLLMDKDYIMDVADVFVDPLQRYS